MSGLRTRRAIQAPLMDTVLVYLVGATILLGGLQPPFRPWPRSSTGNHSSGRYWLSGWRCFSIWGPRYFMKRPLVPLSPLLGSGRHCSFSFRGCLGDNSGKEGLEVSALPLALTVDAAPESRRGSRVKSRFPTVWNRDSVEPTYGISTAGTDSCDQSETSYISREAVNSSNC